MNSTSSQHLTTSHNTVVRGGQTVTTSAHNKRCQNVVTNVVTVWPGLKLNWKFIKELEQVEKGRLNFSMILYSYQEAFWRQLHMPEFLSFSEMSNPTRSNSKSKEGRQLWEIDSLLKSVVRQATTCFRLRSMRLQTVKRHLYQSL